MTEAAETFRVVVNDEGQYSIWPLERDLAPGWLDAGVSGSREACLEHIERTWLDMRPRSLRETSPPARRE